VSTGSAADSLASVFPQPVRALLLIALGLAVIFLLGSIASDMIKHIYVNHSDIAMLFCNLHLTASVAQSVAH
jgi:hypothetical protein